MKNGNEDDFYKWMKKFIINISRETSIPVELLTEPIDKKYLKKNRISKEQKESLKEYLKRKEYLSRVLCDKFLKKLGYKNIDYELKEPDFIDPRKEIKVSEEKEAEEEIKISDNQNNFLKVTELHITTAKDLICQVPPVNLNNHDLGLLKMIKERAEKIVWSVDYLIGWLNGDYRNKNDKQKRN